MEVSLPGQNGVHVLRRVGSEIRRGHVTVQIPPLSMAAQIVLVNVCNNECAILIHVLVSTL